MASELSYSSGSSLPTLLTVLFVALKLTHVINWPWVWVLAPAWISAGVGLLIVAAVLLVFLIKTH